VLRDLGVGGAPQQQHRLALEPQPLAEARDLPPGGRHRRSPDLDVVGVLRGEPLEVVEQIEEALPGVVDDLGGELRGPAKFDRS